MLPQPPQPTSQPTSQVTFMNVFHVLKVQHQLDIHSVAKIVVQAFLQKTKKLVINALLDLLVQTSLI